MSAKAPLLMLVAATISGCAAQRTQPKNASTVTDEQLRASYSCVVEALASAGYPVRESANLAGKSGKLLLSKLQVWGQLREWVSTQDPAVQGENVGGAGSKRSAGEAGTPYTVDGVYARVRLGNRSDQPAIEVSAYTGAGLTARSGYVQRPASSRGLSAITHARACAQVTQLTN